jgi:hypothetical protein
MLELFELLKIQISIVCVQTLSLYNVQFLHMILDLNGHVDLSLLIDPYRHPC